MYPEISESERFPLLSNAGRRLLHRMRQHLHAPIWNWPNGEQLNEAGLMKVRRFADQLATSSLEPIDSESTKQLIEYCLRTVPFYRKRAQRLGHFGLSQLEDLPTCCREDVAPRVWDFVPDDVDLDELIVFSTSGTTGHPTRMLSHPATAACGVPIMELALSRIGQTFPRGPESVAITNVAAYRGAFTTAIVIAYLQEAGCVRVNLDSSAWRRETDCARFINEWKSPVWLGDPIALAALETQSIDTAPQAILSSIMRLTSRFRQQLTSRYGCNVIDLYALTEVGILAMSCDRGHEIIPHDVVVEILDEKDNRVPDGTRGEIVITCGRNPFMPLLRYRTGDFASLERDGNRRWLVGLEGRSPVLFPLPSGRIVHSMEITRLMRNYPLLQYRLLQDAEGGFHFGYRGMVDLTSLARELRTLLEQPSDFNVTEIEDSTGATQKVLEYQSAVPMTAAFL